MLTPEQKVYVERLDEFLGSYAERVGTKNIEEIGMGYVFMHSRYFKLIASQVAETVATKAMKVCISGKKEEMIDLLISTLSDLSSLLETGIEAGAAVGYPPSAVSKIIQ